MIKLKNLLNEDYKTVVADYVNNFEDNGLSQIKNEVPSNLKYKGKAFHIVPLSKSQIKVVLEGGEIRYPNKKIMSWTKSIEGATEAYYNLSADFPDKYKHCLMLEGVIPLNQCIIDVSAFINKFEGLISSNQYSDYEREEEVITLRFLSTINRDMVDGYCIDGEWKAHFAE